MDAEIHVRTEAIETFYDIGDQIGSGQFAVVKKLHCQTSGKTYAAKFMKKKRSKASKKGMSQEQFLREADVLRSIEHKGVIYLHEIFETKLEYVLVLELLTGGELFEFLSEQEFLTEEEAVGFLKQVIEAIEYLHGKRIVHLDIKPENIVLKEEKSSQIKLIDFGLARKLTHGEMVREIMGTPEFVAPEIIAFEDIGTETDMWAIGVLTYIMLSGASPFLGDDVNETFSNISMVDYEFDDEYFKDISLPAKNFISNLLVKDTRDRMNAAECLKHEWMQDLDDQESANSSEDDDICDALIPSPSKRKNEILKRRSTLIKTDAFKAFTARARWQKSLNKVIAISRLALLGKKNGPIQRSIACRDTTTADTTLNKTNNDQDINNRNNIQECTVPEEKVKREFENNTEIYTIPEESTTKEEFQNQSREEKVVSDNVVNENVFKKENVATNDHVEENTIYQEDSHTARSDAFEENQIHLLSDDSSKSRINAKTVYEIKDPNGNIEVKRESRSNKNLEDTSLSSISSKRVEREVKQDDNGFRQDDYDSNNAFKMKLDTEKLNKEDEVHLVQKENYQDIAERDILHSEESGIKSSKDINGQVTQENVGYVSNHDTSEITQKEKVADQGNGAFENDHEVVSHMARLNQVEHKNTPVTISGKIPERDTDKSEYLPLEQDRQVKPHRSVKDEHAEETKSKTSKQDGTPDEKRFYKIRTFENSSSNRKTTKSRDRAIGFEDLKYMFSNPNESDQSSGGFGAHESKSRARRVGGGNLKLVAKMYELDLQANGEERTSKTSGAREESGASRIRKAKPITQTETNVEEPVHSSNSKLNEFGNFSTKRKTSNEFAKLKQNFETEGVSSKDKLGHKHVDSKADYLNKSRKKDRVANGHKTENATKSEDEFKVDRQNDKPLSDLHVLDPTQPTKGGSTRVEKMEDNNDTLAEKADDENGSSSKEQSQATRTSKALEERKRKESTDSDQSSASDSSFPTRSKRFDDSSWLTNRKPFKINKDKTDHMTSRKRKTSARAEILKWEQKSSGEAVPTKSSFSSQSLLKREQEQRRSMPKIATVTKTDLKENRYPFERHSFGGLSEGGEERRNLLSRKGHTNRNQTSKEEKDTTSSTRQQMSGEFLNERKMSSKDTTSDIEIKVTTSTKSGAHAMNISKEVPNYNQYTAGDVHITTTVNKTDVGDYIEKAGETSSETEASVENTADSFAECSSSVTNVTTDEPIGESFTNDTESKIDESENAKEFAMENKSVPENTRKRSTLTRLHSAEGSPNSLGIAAIDKEHVFVIRTSLNSQDSGLDSESEVASVDSLEELDVPETSNATQNVMITQHEVLPKQTDQFPEMALTLQKSPTSPDITDKNAFVWVVTTEKNKRGDFLSKDLAPNVESSKGSSNQADIYEKRRIRHKPMGAKGPPKLRAMSTPLEPVTKKSEVHVRRGRVTSDSSIEKQNVPTVRLTSDMPAFTFKIQQGEIELAD